VLLVFFGRCGDRWGVLHGGRRLVLCSEAFCVYDLCSTACAPQREQRSSPWRKYAKLCHVVQNRLMSRLRQHCELAGRLICPPCGDVRESIQCNIVSQKHFATGTEPRSLITTLTTFPRATQEFHIAEDSSQKALHTNISSF
jgi:hypothetical protein